MSLAVLLLAPLANSTAQAQTITLGGTTTSTPFREYATRELADPWDMSQRTDLGWFTWSVDSPASHLTNKAIATDGRGNTYFTGRIAAGTSDPSIFLLDPWTPGAAKMGKLGVNHRIDTTIYSVLYLKMKIANQILDVPGPVAQVVWSRNTIYSPAEAGAGDAGQILVKNANGFQVGPYLTPQFAEPVTRVEGSNWVIYKIPLTIAQMQQLNPDIHHWENVSGGTTSNWGDPGVTADSLRLIPLNFPDSKVGELQIDWARLVSESAGSAMTISWEPGGTRDIVVSTNADCSDFAVIAYSKSSGYQFQTQILPPGTYYAGLRQPFTSSGHTGDPNTVSCSTESFTVQSHPSLSMTSPGVEGSSDDFATAQLADAWDFNALTDFDFGVHLNLPDASFGIVTKAATDPAGSDLGDVRVFRSQSTPFTSGVGDPYMYTLWPTPEQVGSRFRGQNYRIDTSRYRILTAELGIERPRDLVGGSIARVMWHVDRERRLNGNLAEIESQDIAIRHLDPATENGGKIVLDTIQVDMADRTILPVETDYAQPGSGWNNTCTANPGTTTCEAVSALSKPGADLFRVDFHEFQAATNSYVRRIKLAALERTGNAFNIQWTPSNPSGLGATVTFMAVPPAGGGNYRPSDSGCFSGVTIGSGVPLASGAFTWDPAATPAVTNGSEYFICALIFVGGVVVDEEMSRWPVVVDTSFSGLRPLLRFDRSTVRLAGVRNGTNSPVFFSKTPPETLRISQTGTGTVNWTATVLGPDGNPTSWFTVSPSSGTGTGTLNVSLADDPAIYPCSGKDGIKATIRLTSSDMGDSPQYAQIYATTYWTGGVCPETGSGTAAAFGLVDTPFQNAAGVVGSVGVTGWAVDDVGISSVKLYRNCLSFEPEGNCAIVAGRNVVYMGDADIVPGARPDVEAVYPNYPQAYKAAWGYLLLTNLLPHLHREVMYGGQGTIEIHVLATDVEGNQQWLGRTVFDQIATTIAMTNDTATKPFGAIDIPGQGQVMTGPFWNFGWALTPDTDERAGSGDILVPTNGGTMWVWIDGAPVSNVIYNLCRGTAAVGSPPAAGLYCDDDVANIFGNVTPQPTFQTRTSNQSRYRNLDAGRGAIGAYHVDTTTMTDGRHSIVWSVTDNNGRVDGIGSRDFIVFNGSGSLTALMDAPARVLGDAAPVRGMALDTGAVWGRTTFDLKAPWEVVRPDGDGVRRVRISANGRLELYFGSGTGTGYLMTNGTLRQLPAGSQISNGSFTWAPGVGYLGEYTLVFVSEYGQVPVTVTIYAGSERSRIEGYIDQPRTGSTVGRAFAVAGWAADPTAWQGTGVGAVHLWAFPTGSPVPVPVFLGAAQVGGSRPDVGAVLGTQFEKSGWSLTTEALGPGDYDIVAYFWSTGTRQFEGARTVTVTVR